MTDHRPTSEDHGWRKDSFASAEVFAQFWWAIPTCILIGAAVILPAVRYAKTTSGRQVVAYCAQDQVYAEPIFLSFEKETGIKVRAVFDSEAVKTVGLANRLLAERSHPQCDLFWGNEELRTRQLAARQTFRDTNGWATLGYRSRRVVINTNLMSADTAPRSLLELTNTSWRGRVALAYPQFGTTAAHLHALRQLWGERLWEAWCRGLAANQPFLVDGNSVVVKLVGKGDAWVGLTDSDDVADGQREGLPIVALPMSDETLLIPNTVALVREGPHPQAAEILFDYLQRPGTVQRLVAANALEGSTPSDPRLPTLRVNWAALFADLDGTTKELNQIFLR